MADKENVIAALNLEYGANRRYGYQIERSSFSQLNNILEGVRRTEGDHIEAMLDYLNLENDDTPECGRGFASMLAHLRLNLEFERTAVEAYSTFARETSDAELKNTFQQLARSEAGHINLFKSLIAQVEANEYPVIMYCPICGWEINFGSNPPEGTEVRCEKCKQLIDLTIVEGDFVPVVVDN